MGDLSRPTDVRLRHRNLRRSITLLFILGLLTASCSQKVIAPEAGDEIDPSISGLQTALTFLGADLGTDPATRDLSFKELPAPSIDLSELRRGGPPPDGIPPIDDPVMVPVTEVDFLVDTEPVVAIEVNGEVRAYPIQILIWHEIVNDRVGGIPVTITYCPLCNSALAYERTVTTQRNGTPDSELILDFGTSGLLLNSSLVMYDRQTETLWSHFTADAVHGLLVGSRLTTLPVAITSWATWRVAHPDGLVLSRETGHTREYGQNPYPGYDTSVTPFLFQGEVDGRLTAMTRIAGIALSPEANSAALAIPLITLSESLVIQTTLAETEILVWWVPGTNSVLNLHDIALSKDVGSVGVFSPIVNGRTLSFSPNFSPNSSPTPQTFTDEQTGSTWNPLGQAVRGPLAGTRLQRIEHLDTFWFAWAAFWPDTIIWS